MAKITLQNLKHSYLPFPAKEEHYSLKRISLDWADGGAYALLGPSGCGKTTLLNLISGLLVPTEGEILFDDKDVSHSTPEQRNIAQVFQFPVIYDTMTVYDNLAFPLRNRHVPEAEVDRRVKEIIEMIGLSDRANKRAQGLTAAPRTRPLCCRHRGATRQPPCHRGPGQQGSDESLRCR